MASYEDERQYIGNQDQLIRVNRYEMKDGKADGCELLDVMNRSGMHFDVNLSRGMDIPYLDFCGQNVGFISPVGVVAPAYFDDKGLGFLKSFTCGFLTTCGLKMAGAPCEYEGKEYGLHGNVSNTPATNVCYHVEGADVPTVVIRGSVRDAVIFDTKLRLDREIRCAYEERKFTLHDTVTNEGFSKARHMILYHCNIGYPILSPESEIFIPATKTVPRDEHAATGLDSCMKLQEADPAYQEMCYYQTLKPDATNHATVAVFNPAIDTGIAIKIDLSTLDHLVEWKMMGAGDYVLGLEPGNTTIDGIEDAIRNGSMKYLEAGQSVEYNLEVSILKGNEEFESVRKQ